MQRPPDITVAVPGGKATYRRLSPTTAEMEIENETDASTGLLGRTLAEDVQTLCEEEIDAHLDTLRLLQAELLGVLNHEGTGVEIAHTDRSRLRRGWALHGGGRVLRLDGMRVASTVRVTFDDPKVSDAAVAEAILSNVMQAREQHLNNSTAG